MGLAVLEVLVEAGWRWWRERVRGADGRLRECRAGVDGLLLSEATMAGLLDVIVNVAASAVIGTHGFRRTTKGDEQGVIEQAERMLAERAAITLDEACNRIRLYARFRDLRLMDVCQAVLRDTLPSHHSRKRQARTRDGWHRPRIEPRVRGRRCWRRLGPRSPG
jgi:hypothetical protein